jgi:hypothetical protein
MARASFLIKAARTSRDEIARIKITACEGDRASNKLYIQLRGMLLAEPSIKPLLPSFVRTSRDLNHFWSYIRGQSGQWEARR